jgi:RNA polymerase sigma-B factor
VTPDPASPRQVEEQRLLEAWLRHSDIEARDELLHRLLPLARRLARRYEGRGESYEDLVQVASIGLMKAVDRFDPQRGTSLRAYAERMAEGELRHHLRDAAGLLHVPRALHARVRAVSSTAARLGLRPGRRPTPSEISSALELTPAEVADALQVGWALDEIHSLDEGAGRPDDLPLGYADKLGRDDAGFLLVEDRSVIDRVWRSLDPRERESLSLRFVEDLTYREIAARLDLSVTHVVRLVERALARLQTVADASKPE